MTKIDNKDATFTRRVMLAGGTIAAAGLLGTAATQLIAPSAARAASSTQSNIALEIYHGLVQNDFDRWDAVVHPDVKANSPAGRDIGGLENLKKWQQAFTDAFSLRVDLVDHFVSGDRGLMTVTLHWTHDRGPIGGIAPTGKSGTSIESFLFRIKDGKVVEWNVADQSLDLAIYLHDQGMKMPTNVTPPVEIKG